MNQIWMAFLTGVTTGAISCMVVQGGLLATSIAEHESKRRSVGIFLIAKIIAHTILGFLLGAAGSALVISPTLQAWMQIFIGVFMITTAARLLNLHPIFRYFVIQPPKFVYRLVKNEARGKSIFTPAILGAMTILIPCGVTQAMMVLAVGSRSPLFGAGILFAFTLGTSPVFFTLGVAASSLMKRKAFVYISSMVIFVLGVVSINTGQILRGSSQTLQNYGTVLKSVFNNSKPTGQVAGTTAQINAQGKQEATINVTSGGYSAPSNVLKVKVPVKLTMISNNAQGCVRSFIIPSLGISKILPQNGNTEIEFTPVKTGTLAYSCGMGMYTGAFNVIE